MIYCAIHFCHIPYQLTTRSDHSDHSGHAFRPLLFPRTLNVCLSVHISFCSCTPIRRPGSHPTRTTSDPVLLFTCHLHISFHSRTSILIIIRPRTSSDLGPSLLSCLLFLYYLRPFYYFRYCLVSYSLLSPSALLLPTLGI